MTQAEVNQLRRAARREPLITTLDADGLAKCLESAGFLLADWSAPSGDEAEEARRLAGPPTLGEWITTALGAAAETGTRAPAEEEARRWLGDCLRARAAAELGLWRTPAWIVAAELIPAIYVWRGDRNPARDYQLEVARGGLSPLAGALFAELMAHARLSASELCERIGRQRTSALAVLRGLDELWIAGKVERFEAVEGEPRWSALASEFPAAVAALNKLSRTQAAADLTLRALRLLRAAEAGEITDLLAPVLTRNGTEGALAALATAGLVAAATIEGRPGWRLVE